MNDTVRQLATFAPALIAQLKGNPVALEEFTRGYQATLAQQQEQRMRQQTMTQQGEDRQRLITRQGEQDRIAGEERDYQQTVRGQQDALRGLQIPGQLAELGATGETPDDAKALIESVMPRILQGFGQDAMAYGQPAVEMATRTITARQKAEVRRFLDDVLKSSHVADNPDADPQLTSALIPPRIQQLIGKTEAPLSEIQRWADAPVGKPAGRPSDTASMQPKEVMVNGKPVFANYNPKTGIYTDQSGQPVTAEVIPPKPTGSGGVEGAFPPAVQRRIDAKVRGFESNAVVKRTATMAEAVSFSDALDPNTKNPADDQALIYAFAKAMDPDSVVREGEYATVQKYAQSWADQFGFDVKRIFSNTAFLTPQARQQLKATIRTKYGAARGQFENIRSEYGRQIERITRMPGGVEELPDFGAAFPSVEAQAGGKPKRGANPFRPQ